MPFALFVNSADSITLEPEWDFEESGSKIEDMHRMRDGSLFRYKWGSFDKWKFSVMFVNSATKNTINEWFDTNQKLLFMEVGDTAVHSVYLSSKKLPIGKVIKPYTDQFRGTIELETY